MRTYVEFIRPARGIPQGISTTVEVADRDVSKLAIPPAADFFYFYDSADGQKDQHDISRFYIVAERILTREEAKELIAPVLKNNSVARIRWDERLEQNEIFALTRNNNIEPVRKDSIVIDARKNQLYPRPVPKPELKAAPDFKMACDRVIIAPSPAKFRPRRPTP